MFERTGELSVKAEPGREFFAAPKAHAVCRNPAETASRAGPMRKAVKNRRGGARPFTPHFHNPRFVTEGEIFTF
jgi:hypothetical protein